jgi:hypothetical protein
MLIFSHRKPLSGSEPFEALGEEHRNAGIDPPRKAGRDALAVVLPRTARADPFELRIP